MWAIILYLIEQYLVCYGIHREDDMDFDILGARNQTYLLQPYELSILELDN